MNCWFALSTAADLAEAGHVAGLPHRWRHEAQRVRTWVQQHCWSDRLGAYTFHAGSEDLDASVLLGARTGFDRGGRMSSTIDVLRRELGAPGTTRPGLLYRYTGMAEEEQAFLACSYWAVEALALCGRHVEASSLMADLAAVASPLGLLSEMCDPATGELVGNLPQALSHLALVVADATLRRCAPDDQDTARHTTRGSTP